ncbi:MAG: hypothetical protein A2061_03960 [Gallionellales bacterium GWA2_59_43]|nr:MAG: hypothetical protein A2061_03960 [Gallionellales bacterium GWA2_59_43]
MPICRSGNRLNGINHMIVIEAGKNPFPELRVGKIIAFAQLSQMDMALDSKSMRFVTSVRYLPKEVIVLPAIMVMNQLPGSKCSPVFSDHLMHMTGVGTAG